MNRPQTWITWKMKTRYCHISVFQSNCEELVWDEEKKHFFGPQKLTQSGSENFILDSTESLKSHGISPLYPDMRALYQQDMPPSKICCRFLEPGRQCVLCTPEDIPPVRSLLRRSSLGSEVKCSMYMHLTDCLNYDVVKDIHVWCRVSDTDQNNNADQGNRTIWGLGPNYPFALQVPLKTTIVAVSPPAHLVCLHRQKCPCCQRLLELIKDRLQLTCDTILQMVLDEVWAFEMGKAGWPLLWLTIWRILVFWLWGWNAALFVNDIYGEREFNFRTKYRRTFHNSVGKEKFKILPILRGSFEESLLSPPKPGNPTDGDIHGFQMHISLVPKVAKFTSPTKLTLPLKVFSNPFQHLFFKKKKKEIFAPSLFRSKYPKSVVLLMRNWTWWLFFFFFFFKKTASLLSGQRCSNTFWKSWYRRELLLWNSSGRRWKNEHWRH